MAVTVTVAELAVSLRIIAEVDGAIDPAVAAVLTRHRAAAVALVEHYAPLAPAAVQDEAATRVVGYLHDAPAGIIRTVNVARASGATALLAPWRGTGAAAAPSGDSVVAPGGPGTDQVARDAAAAAQAAAVAARAAADRAQMTADAAAAAVQDASVSADDQVARDAAAEARALAVLAQGSADRAERLALQAQRAADAAQVTATAAAGVAAFPTDQVARDAAAAAQSSADAALAAGGGGGDGLITVLPPGEDLPVCTEADYLVGAGLIQGATRFYATRYGHSEIHSSWNWRAININIGPFVGTAREYIRPGPNQVPMWPGGDLPDGFLGVVSGGPATAALEIGSLDEDDDGAWAFDGHARRWLRFVGGNFAVSNPPPDRDRIILVRRHWRPARKLVARG